MEYIVDPLDVLKLSVVSASLYAIIKPIIDKYLTFRYFIKHHKYTNTINTHHKYSHTITLITYLSNNTHINNISIHIHISTIHHYTLHNTLLNILGFKTIHNTINTHHIYISKTHISITIQYHRISTLHQ